MKKISLLVLFYGIFISLLQADLIHNFDNQRFDGNRYEELGSQSGNLQDFTVIIRLESDIIKNGLYAWALRCDDAQGKLQWAFYGDLIGAGLIFQRIPQRQEIRLFDINRKSTGATERSCQR